MYFMSKKELYVKLKNIFRLNYYKSRMGPKISVVSPV